jgi:hypothetical protein
MLGQESEVGEHLAEIYEKQGRAKEAAHTYELALAAQPAPTFRMSQASAMLSTTPPPDFDANGYRALRAKIVARYERLTGKKPSNETWRLPNGGWTKTWGEELSEMRAVKLGKQPKLSGSAQFSIVFAMGEIESVKYVSGKESLQSLTGKLKASHYRVEFPAASKAKILRRAELSCTPASGCTAVLLPVTSAIRQ